MDGCMLQDDMNSKMDIASSKERESKGNGTSGSLNTRESPLVLSLL